MLATARHSCCYCRRYSVRCDRETLSCARGDADCLYAPIFYSINVMTMSLSALRAPVDLFTMRGPLTARRRLEFHLQLIHAHHSTTADEDTDHASPIGEDFFSVDQVDTAQWRIKLAFHDADTDTDTNILARILADKSDTRDFRKLFVWQAERHADILATILARMSARICRCRIVYSLLIHQIYQISACVCDC